MEISVHFVEEAIRWSQIGARWMKDVPEVTVPFRGPCGNARLELCLEITEGSEIDGTIGCHVLRVFLTLFKENPRK